MVYKKQYNYSDVAIIIPVYNEDKVVGSVIKSLSSKFKNIVCVNDGSSDDTLKVLEQSPCYYVDHPINMGQGAALQTGIEFARRLDVKYFVTFDADGQHNINDVETMLDVICKGKYDILLGSRFLGNSVGMSNSKKIVLKLAILFTNATSGVKLTDTHNGLRVFNKTVADSMQITQPDMSHASEIIETIGKNKYRYKEVPVTIKYTDYSRSKGQSTINAINIAFDAVLRRLIK